MLREMDLTAALRTGFGSVTLSNAGRELDLEDNRTGGQSPPGSIFRKTPLRGGSQ
jgi:hypothetical protein